MTRQALAQDRGRQPERTALAWSRTSLAVVVTGGLLLSKERDVTSLIEHSERLVVGAVAVVVAAAIHVIGVRRSRALAVRHQVSTEPGRNDVLATGAAIFVLTLLVLAHLLIPVL